MDRWMMDTDSRDSDNRELLQGDAASCATHEATNLDGTAFFGPLCLTSAFAMSDAAQPNFSSCALRSAYDVTIHTLTKTARVIVCVQMYIMHERIPSPRKVSDWLILQASAASGLPVRPYFWRLPLCGFEGYAGFQARNYANCRNLHTTRTI